MLTASSTAEVIPLDQKPLPERFVMLRYSLLDSSAWQSLPPIARALYVEMAHKYNGRNNGQIPFSRREGAKALGVNKSTISRTEAVLERNGLIRRTGYGELDLKTKKTKPSEWELRFQERGAPAHPGALENPGEGCATGTKKDRYKKESIDREKKQSGLPKEEGREESKQELREGFPLSDSPISSPSKDGGGVPRAAPNGGGGDSVWVRYDTPEWDRVERFGHRAVGKVFIRYGRVEGSWILKSDLRAIDTLAAANGGGQ